MKTKIILLAFIFIGVSFCGFKLLKSPTPAQKCFTAYTLTLAEIGPLTSENNYIVNDSCYDSYFSDRYTAGTTVAIHAAEAIQGNSSTDYYFFRYWDDGNTNAIRNVTMNSDIYLTPIYTNKQGVQWVAP